MLNVGAIVLDRKTGGTGLVIDVWSDYSVTLDLALPGGRQVIVTRNTADLDYMGRPDRRRGRW
jgi:hypothetical protein